MVYFIEAEKTGLIKIGYTISDASLRKRISQLATEGPDKLRVILLLSTTLNIDKGAQLEAQLHKKFAAYRDHGEWFRPGKELVAFIIAHQKHLQETITKPFPQGGNGTTISSKATNMLAESLKISELLQRGNSTTISSNDEATENFIASLNLKETL